MRPSERIAGLLFGALLRLLPRALRQEYGPAMRSDFSEMAATSGRVWRTWLHSVADLLRRLPAEWRRSRRARERRDVGERIGTMWRELGQSARALMKRPGFTFVTVLTLGLGFGANVAIFAVVHSVVLEPLPYPEPDDVVVIAHHAPGLDLENIDSSPGMLALYQEQARSFSGLAGSLYAQRNVTGGDEPVRLSGIRASPSLFAVLRVPVVLGRALTEDDAVEGAPPVVVLSYATWQAHFGGARDVIGSTVQLDGVPTEVVGVLSPEFAYPDPEMAFVLPMVTPAEPSFGDFGMRIVARLRDGVGIEQAAAEVEALQTQVPERFDVDATFLRNAGWRASVETLRDRVVGDTATMLWIVFGTVSFLLLVACASVANLFLVRAESRQREFGIRVALGASNPRVAAVFLYESVLLALAGGALGLVLGTGVIRLLVAFGPTDLPRLHEIAIDGDVIAYGFVVSVLAGLIFGALPLLRRGTSSLVSLMGSARGNTVGRDRQAVRKALIVTQIALAIVLLTGSGLMLRSFQRLTAVEPGIRTANVLTVGLSVGDGMGTDRAAALYQELLDEAAALPGVAAVGLTNALPLQPASLDGSSYDIESKPRGDDELQPVAIFSVITDGYLDAIGTPLVAGRNIERADAEHRRNVVLINETFARMEFSGVDPIGQRIRFSDDAPWLEIVGVVGDVRLMGLDEDLRPIVYLPMTSPVTEASISLMYLTARTTGDPMTLAQPLLAVIRRASSDLPILAVRTMDDVLRASMAETSFTTTIILVAAVVALLLGAVGLYGVIGYVVSQRTREIGLRLALGALPGQVRRMVLRQGLDLALIGTVLGIAAAVALTRLLESQLHEVDSRDPLTFAIVPIVLLAVSAVAAYLPARRASRVPPMHALRED